MQDIKIMAAKVAGALEHMWERLSVTQQLMLRGISLFAVLVLLGGVVGGWAPASVAPTDGGFFNGTASVSNYFKFRSSLDSTRGEFEVARLRLARAEAVLAYSAKYSVPADLAALIYDIALQEGIDPELGFRLVNVESSFTTRAVSHANAYGLTQLQLATARFYDSEITMEELFDPERNLRIGFRFLRDLIENYGDINLALLAYNRGPSRLKDLIDAGRNPDNGYPGVLMEGYTGGF